MGRKLDLSGLTDDEAEHVLQVVQRDMRLRKTEEERLSDLKQELDEEGSRCLLLSRQSCFNQRCCIRCCAPFTFLLNPKRQCQDCLYNVCKACRVYNKQDKGWLCSACQKSRLLKTQAQEWFYANVKRRFKRFGSAKVLKTLYRKHLAEHRALSELTEASAYEESICNEGSVCGSDSTFYKQTEEHSMAETLTVAMRVAEEAIDEAISTAEFDSVSQEKQHEANYLREHRGELIEELAKTIVQKIITRRKTLAEMREGYDQDGSLEHDAELHHYLSAGDQASSSIKQPQGLWRSHSAFSLLDNDPPGLIQEIHQALKKDGGASALSAWKSVDRLDNSGLGVSPVFKSPDGNWIALQSSQLSRPSLLTKRKSQVFSALERESGAVSAYECMDSDDETRPELNSSWGAVLQEIHRKMTDSKVNVQDTQELTDQEDCRDDQFSDSDGIRRPKKPQLFFFKRKVPAEIRRPSSSRRTSIIDVNFHMTGAGEESSVVSEPETGRVKRSRKKRRSKKRTIASSPGLDYNKKGNQCPRPTDAVTPDALTSEATTPELLESDITGCGANQTDQELTGGVSDSCTGDDELHEARDETAAQSEERRQGNKDEDDERMEIDLAEGKPDDEKEEEEKDIDEDEMKYRLYKLVAQSRLAYFSSTDDELDRAGRSEGDRERDEDMEEEYEDQIEEQTEGLTYKLCQLEREVRTTQFSSTEDELDRVGLTDEEKSQGEEEEELAVKVCRLAHQVNASQFSSTEDELDRAGRDDDEEEVIVEETLWKLQEENAAQVRNLASLISASQFSSTEDELDRVGEDEEERTEEVNRRGGIDSSIEMEEEWNREEEERRESMEDLDVNMFDLREEIKEDDKEDEEAITENSAHCQTETRHGERELGESETRDCVEDRVTEETGDERTGGEVEVLNVNVTETEGKEERAEEIIAFHEIRENQPKARETEKKEAADEKEEEKMIGSNVSQGFLGAASDSDQDAEFDRILGSMLMMTLEDMRAEARDDVGEKEGMKRELEEDGCMREESDREDEGGAGEPRSQGDDRRSESDVRPDDGAELTVGDPSRNLERGDPESRNESEHQEEDAEPQQEPVAEEILPDVTMKEAKETCEEEVDEYRREMNERQEETKEHADDLEQSSISSPQGGLLSPEEIQNASTDTELYKVIQFISTLLEQRYSAASLRSITTEVLKVLNATEELLQGVEGRDGPHRSTTTLPPNTDPKKLDEQFSRLEENVYVAAGTVYHLEAELSDLEDSARGICSTTSDMELSFMEEQVASAAAKVQQSERQISDISARIAALKSAGLNVDPQSRVAKTKTTSVTLDSSRQQRRRLPAPPVKEDKDT